MNISVALAAYNGELYIEEQIRSILDSISADDELVVSLNESSDNTEEIVRSLAAEDNRINLVKCKKMGIIPNFNYAVRHT